MRFMKEIMASKPASIEEAYKALESKIGGQSVSLDIMDMGHCRRMVAIVRLDKRELNREMVAKGMAWA